MGPWLDSSAEPEPINEAHEVACDKCWLIRNCHTSECGNCWEPLEEN